MELQEARMAESLSVVRSAYAAFQRGDVPAVLELAAPDVRWNYFGSVPWAGERTGKEQVGQFFGVLGGALDIKEFEPTTFVSEGEQVAVFGRTVATARQTGKTYENRWVHHFVVTDGKIARYAGYDTQPL